MVNQLTTYGSQLYTVQIFQTRKSLQDPQGLLSETVPFMLIEEVNKEVKTEL